jgi:exonuclease SbcD
MRIIHTSDWHLGISVHNASLMEEQKNFIEFLLAAAKEYKADAVIISGDIFDNSVSSSEAISIYNHAMTNLCNNLNIPVIISAGNHDGAARLSSCSELLKKSGLYITGKLSAEIKPVEFGTIFIYPLPYFNTDEVRAIYPDEKINSYSDAMNCVVKKIKSNFKPGCRNILMCHCFVGGSELSESDRSAMVGGSNAVSEEIFEGFDYIAMGHLHKPQRRGHNIRYSGSPLKYSFSESSHKKSLTVIDIGSDIKSEEIEVIPTRDMRVIKGTYEDVIAFAENDKSRDDYIKIELTDSYAGIEALETFRIYYKNLLCISGRTNETDESQLTVEELNSLSTDDILERFYKDVTGQEITEEQKQLFSNAMAQVEKGGDEQ